MSTIPETKALTTQTEPVSSVAPAIEVNPDSEGAQSMAVDSSVEPAVGAPSTTLAVPVEPQSSISKEIVSPAASGLETQGTTGEHKALESVLSGTPEPGQGGFLSYRKSAAKLPIYHRRFFFFSDAPIPLTRLQALYEKNKSKADKDELNQLIAQAAASGKGLLFYSKTPDSVPSGVIECARMLEISADESMSDKFHISYNAKQTFTFETGTASREAWISNIAKHKETSDAEIDTIRSSANYQAILRSLEAGEAFNPVEVPEGANEVLSDDENAGASASPNKQDKVIERPAASKRASFLRVFNAKPPHEKAV